MPEPGDVIPYWYLWWRERGAGEESGRKLRPCVVLVVALKVENGAAKVALLPITHSPPNADDAAIELPVHVKRRLGLDEKPSWIVCDEFNDFSWPGYDLGKTPSGQATYGKLPRRLFVEVRNLALAAIRARKARVVSRD